MPKGCRKKRASLLTISSQIPGSGIPHLNGGVSADHDVAQAGHFPAEIARPTAEVQDFKALRVAKDHLHRLEDWRPGQ